MPTLLSSRIRFAMMVNSILPVVEIHSPSGTVTFVNAKRVNVGPPVSHTPRLGDGEVDDNQELELVAFTYQKIEMGSVSNSAGFDNWSGGAPKKK